MTRKSSFQSVPLNPVHPRTIIVRGRAQLAAPKAGQLKCPDCRRRVLHEDMRHIRPVVARRFQFILVRPVYDNRFYIRGRRASPTRVSDIKTRVCLEFPSLSCLLVIMCHWPLPCYFYSGLELFTCRVSAILNFAH